MSNSWLDKTWLVARREIAQGVRTRSFRVSTILLALAVAAAVVLPTKLSRHPTEHIGLLDPGPPSTGIVQAAARIAGVSATVATVPDMATAEAQLQAGTMTAVLVDTSEVLVKQTGTGSSSGSSTLVGAIAQLAGLQRLGLNQAVALPVRGLLPPPRSLGTRLTGLFAAALIYYVISIYGSRITVGVGEEKASRVVEVLLATIRPAQLLAGKVIGLGTLALSQVAILLATFLVLGKASGSHAVHGPSAGVVAVAAMWMVVGYAFYATAFAAAGSLVERSSDATVVSIPVQLPILAAYLLSFSVVSGNPSVFYRILSFFPPTAPVASTVLYAAGDTPGWQVALSALIALAGIAASARIAAIVYERAILQTGGRLRLRQVLRATR